MGGDWKLKEKQIIVVTCMACDKSVFDILIVDENSNRLRPFFINGKTEYKKCVKTKYHANCPYCGNSTWKRSTTGRTSVSVHDDSVFFIDDIIVTNTKIDEDTYEEEHRINISAK